MQGAPNPRGRVSFSKADQVGRGDIRLDMFLGLLVVGALWIQQTGILLLPSLGLAPLVRIVAQLSAVVYVAASMLLVLGHLADSRRWLGAAPLLVAPAIYMVCRDFADEILRPVPFVFVLLVMAFMTLRAPMELYLRLTAVLVVIVAIASLLLGSLSPVIGLRTDIASEILRVDKEVLQGMGLLKGPFGSENNLGNYLVLGLPFVILFRSRLAVYGSFIVVGSALLWTSSRSSLAGAFVILTMIVLGQRLRGHGYMVILSVIAVLGVLLPFVPQDEMSFSGRGAIWAGLVSTLGFPYGLLGRGTLAFDRLSADAQTYINSAAIQGHNQALHLLVVGGATLFFLTAAMLWRVALTASRLEGEIGVAARAWLMALFTVGILEVPLGFSDRATFWPVVLVPLAVLLAPRLKEIRSTRSTFCRPRTKGRIVAKITRPGGSPMVHQRSQFERVYVGHCS